MYLLLKKYDKIVQISVINSRKRAVYGKDRYSEKMEIFRITGS
jgi:hypothetical protein